MEEVARTKITGEEETFSHTDLWDFQANVEGAEVAYGTVRDIANSKGAAAKQVVRTLDSEFSGIQTLLAQVPLRHRLRPVHGAHHGAGEGAVGCGQRAERAPQPAHVIVVG